MDRRAFLGTLGILIGGVAVEQAIPLGRVWSFPKRIVIPRHALPGRIDTLALEHWFKIEPKVIDFYEVSGQTVFPVYEANDHIIHRFISEQDFEPFKGLRA